MFALNNRRTFELSKHNIWNLKLNNREKLFTFFVPGQKAWDDFRSEMPNEYNQMTMDVYKYHVQKILDRHLVVGDEISSQELERKDNLQMVNGVVDVKRGLGNADVYLEWEGIQAVIVRPDVQATNGVIHVIDRVLMKQRDMMRTGGTPGFYPSLVLCVSTLLVHWM
ncbi:fasciclin-1-like [Tachypleus tridentatus]|uniref:fasciclin-1-like n=1 Tax=Tachypleus tridentatus TaxID=6853 RepID=UPI003FD4860D